MITNYSYKFLKKEPLRVKISLLQGPKGIKQMHDTTGSSISIFDSIFNDVCFSHVSTIVYHDTTGLTGVVIVEGQYHDIDILVTSVNQSKCSRRGERH